MDRVEFCKIYNIPVIARKAYVNNGKMTVIKGIYDWVADAPADAPEPDVTPDDQPDASPADPPSVVPDPPVVEAGPSVSETPDGPKVEDSKPEPDWSRMNKTELTAHAVERGIEIKNLTKAQIIEALNK